MENDNIDLKSRGERVCDRCTLKKTKCNRQKPSCSRCADNGVECTYSAQKRKPGPPKGYHSKIRRISVENTQLQDADFQSNNSLSAYANTATQPPDYAQDLVQASSASRATVSPQQNGLSQTSSHSHVQSESISRLSVYNGLSREAEIDLLDVYLLNVQPYYPLFQRSQLLHQYSTGQMSREMFCAIGTVSAALSKDAEVIMFGAHKLTENYASVVRTTCSPFLMSDTTATVDDLRMLFLLALYEFRNLPSRRAWTTIGHLMRLCYDYGIHQVDNPVNCSFYDQRTTTAQELESWRYLWWSTYVLDCCCNTTVSTPSNIDLDCLCTAFPAGSIQDWTNGIELHPATRRFLSQDIEEICDTVRDLTSGWLKNTASAQEVDVDFVVRIFNTSQLNAVCDLRRAILANPKKQFHKRWQSKSAQVAAFRLSLPSRYLNPQRLVSAGETKEAHTVRLGVLLEIGITNLLLCMPRTTNSAHDDAWFISWESSMDAVYKIVDTVRQWDSMLCHLSDPPVTFIVFIAACMLHINLNLQRSPGAADDPDNIDRASWTVCKAFLQQMGERWLLSKALNVAIEKFKTAVTYPVSLSSASELLKNMQKLLGFRFILEHKLSRTEGHYSMESPLYPETFEVTGLEEWLSIFEQDQDSFMSTTALDSLDMVPR